MARRHITNSTTEDKTEGIRTGDVTANYVFNNFLRPAGTSSVTTAAAPATAFDLTPATSGMVLSVQPGVNLVLVPTGSTPLQAGGTSLAAVANASSGASGERAALQVSGPNAAAATATIDRLFALADPYDVLLVSNTPSGSGL